MLEAQILLVLVVLYVLVLGAAISLALWRGSWRERTASLALLANWLACAAFTRPQRGWVHVQWGQFWPDLILFAVLVACAYRAPRRWPAVAAGLQLAAVLIHLAFGLFPGLWPPAYATALQLIGWALVTTLLWASASARRPSAHP